MNEAPRRPTVGVLLSRPAHFMALGAGSGLSPVAPGTVGTLWAWLSFVALQTGLSAGPHGDLIWAGILLVGWPVGCWACTRTAQHLRVSDPGAIVWDEIWAFWLMLWLIGPVGWQGRWPLSWRFGFLMRPSPAPSPGPMPCSRWCPGKPLVGARVWASCSMTWLRRGVPCWCWPWPWQCETVRCGPPSWGDRW